MKPIKIGSALEILDVVFIRYLILNYVKIVSKSC